jgi:RNA polymerase sigma factor (sigma-70 family)
MASGLTGSVLLREIEALHRMGLIAALSDGELLERFAAGSGRAADAAFSALLDRHGPMVLHVCRQVLSDAHEAEDAFQATFLILVRKARSVRKRDSVASWLYGVAHRVSMQVRTVSARRRVHERRASRRAWVDGLGRNDVPESWTELHEEIGRLPPRYREPIVLCYLEGLTTEAAACRLGCPKGTVLSRLSRARAHLRKRLTHRGLVFPAGLLAVSLGTNSAQAALPGTLRDLTIQGSLRFAEQPITAAAATSTAVSLAKGVLQAMAVSKFKIFAAAALACGLTVGGVKSFARLGAATQQEPAVSQVAADQVAQAAPGQEPSRNRATELQARLEVVTRRNEELQKQLHDLQTELRALREISRRGTDRRSADRSAAGPKDKALAAEPVSNLSSQSRGDKYQFGDNAPQQGALVLDGYGPDPSKAGSSSAPTHATYLRSHSGLIFASSPTGNRVICYNPFSRSEQSEVLNATKESPIEVSFRDTGELVFLLLKGPRITRVAVYDIPAGAWRAIDLSEPVKGELRVSARVGEGTAAYDVGSHLYTYSVRSGVWDHLDIGKISDSAESQGKGDAVAPSPAKR